MSKDEENTSAMDTNENSVSFILIFSSNIFRNDRKKRAMNLSVARLYCCCTIVSYHAPQTLIFFFAIPLTMHQLNHTFSIKVLLYDGVSQRMFRLFLLIVLFGYGKSLQWKFDCDFVLFHLEWVFIAHNGVTRKRSRFRE